MSLTKREKQIVLIGILCLGLLLAFQVFVRPAFGRITTLKRVVTNKQEILRDLQSKSEDYKILRGQFEHVHLVIEHQQKGGKILSVIESIQKDCGLMQNVVEMTPTTTMISDAYEKTDVEVKYTSVTLDQLIKFLTKIESSELLTGVRSLEIKRGIQNPDLLDVAIRLISVSNIEQD